MIKDRSYKISFACAVALHILLIVLLCLKFTSNIKQPALQPNVNIVKAFSVSQNTVDQYFTQVDAEKKQTQQAEEQARLQQQQQAEQKLTEAKKEKLEQQLKQQMLAEQAKEAQIIKKQQKQLEEQQKVAAKKQEQKKLQDSLDKQIAKEADQLKKQAKIKETKSDVSKVSKDTNTKNNSNNSSNSSSKSAPQSAGEIDKYKALIIQAISQEWIIPDGVDKDAVCKLLVKVAPGGVVLNADIIQGSGNVLLDRSAQNAVLRASPLPVPKDGALFDSFRTIQLTVRPQEIISG